MTLPVTASAIRRSHAVTRLAYLVVGLPTLGTAAAIALAVHDGGVSRTALASMAVLYLVGAAGVEVGFHRYFSHRAFKCKPALRFALAAAGSIAAQGTVLYWAAVHRAHHRHADTDLDPHAPRPLGPAGLWRAHVGWLFEQPCVDFNRGLGDLLNDRTTMAAQRAYLGFLGFGLVAPAALGYATGGGSGALEGFLWGGAVRIFLNHHATWSVNSLCHLVGRRPYETRDTSRNFWVLALPTLGGAWHNNHHAHPSSATNDHRWWQLDLGAALIRGAAKLGWAWDVIDFRRAEEEGR